MLRTPDVYVNMDNTYEMIRKSRIMNDFVLCGMYDAMDEINKMLSYFIKTDFLGISRCVGNSTVQMEL
jgi:hypothetical protein